MNSLSAMHGVWAAIVASPGCCRLLAVSVEVAVLAVAVWCLIRVLRIRSARVCSLLWILVLAKGLFGLAFGAPLEVTALRLTESARPSQSATAAVSAEDLARQEAEMQRALREAETSAGASVASAPNGTDGTQASSPVAGMQATRRSTQSRLSGLFASLSRFSLAAHAAGLLTAVWLAGVLWALLATALDLRRIRDLARASGAPSGDLLAVFRAEAARLGIARVPALSVCTEVESPALAGFLRPTVLAPAWLAETADPGQLRWMLAHELMHYKQKDTVGLLVRRAAQVALWFHPAVWWAGRQWEEAMERACDRALIAGEADARHYAEQLHGVLKSLMARRSRVRVVTGLFATRTQIGKRIAALLTDSLAMPARLSPSSATLVALFAVAVFALGLGTNRPAPAQEPVGIASPRPAPVPAPPTGAASAPMKATSGSVRAQVFDAPPPSDQRAKPGMAEAFFAATLRAVEILLYGQEGMADAAKEGREMSSDPSSFQITVTDTPDRLERVRDFLATLSQLPLAQRPKVIRIYHQPADTLAETLRTMGLDIAGATTSTAASRSCMFNLTDPADPVRLRDIEVRLRRVNPSRPNGPTEASCDLTLRIDTPLTNQATNVTLNEYESQFVGDYEIFAQEIRPGGGRAGGRVTLVLRYFPPGGSPSPAPAQPLRIRIVTAADNRSLIVLYEDPNDMLTLRDLIDQLDFQLSPSELLAKTRDDLEAVATAMESFRVDHGDYPRLLSDLRTPKAYLSDWPVDFYATGGHPDPYRLNFDTPDRHPVVYSVGPDGVDQKGLQEYVPESGEKSPGDIVRRLQNAQPPAAPAVAAPAGPATAPANPAVSLAAAAPSVNGAAGSLPTKSSLYVAVRRNGSRVGLEHILLRMGKDGVERQVPLDSLSREVAKAKVSFPDLRVVIQPSADSASATVVAVLEELRKGGVEDIGIEVVPEKPGGPTVPATAPPLPAGSVNLTTATRVLSPEVKMYLWDDGRI